MNPTKFFEAVQTYFDQGGFVMPPLALATLLLWYALGYRFITLQRGSKKSCRLLLEERSSDQSARPRGFIDGAVARGVEVCRLNPGHAFRPILDDAFGDFQHDLVRGKTAIRSVVSTAPLAGLLGTVIGMIETFDSLGDMALFSQTGGIAGGISQALFTTQMGLAVAVPGIILGRLLDRRQAKFEHELDQIKDWLSGSKPSTGHHA